MIHIYLMKVTLIFNAFAKIYGAETLCRKFHVDNLDDLKQDDGVIQFWAESLYSQKISADEINKGAENILTCKFVPSLPEFLTLCKPSKQEYAVLYNKMIDEARQRANGENNDKHCIILFNVLDRFYKIQIDSYMLFTASHNEFISDFIKCYHDVKFLDRDQLKPLPLDVLKIEKQETLEDKNYRAVFVKYIILSIKFSNFDEIVNKLYEHLPNLDKKFIYSKAIYIKNSMETKEYKKPKLKLVKSA